MELATPTPQTTRESNMPCKRQAEKVSLTVLLNVQLDNNALIVSGYAPVAAGQPPVQSQHDQMTSMFRSEEMALCQLFLQVIKLN